MIETERLVVKPLNYQELLTYLEGNNKLEREWGLRFTGRTVSPDIRKRVKEEVIPIMKNLGEEEQLYQTFWLVIDKVSLSIVAELGFKGLPNAQGEIEIGYGTMPSQQGMGYMTEAVGGILQWAAGQKAVSAVLASIDKDNKASIRIAEKNGFVLYDEKPPLLWWKKAVK